MYVKSLPLVFYWAPVFWTLFVPACAQSQGTGSISGRVVDPESGDGIRKAIVTLTLGGTPRQWATGRTDGEGHFEFDGLPAGTYTLQATKGDEGRAIDGANSVRELGGSITLAEGEKRGVSLRFLRGATISGRVYDADGDPVVNAIVMLLRRGRSLGAPTLGNYRGVPTDDRGEYHVWNVDPGIYYLRASPQLFGGGQNKELPILMDQYYGGTRDSKDASPIRVSGGNHLENLDFHLTSEMTVRIHGQVVGVPDEAQPPQEAKPAGDRFAIVNGPFVGGGAPGPRVQVTISPADGFDVRWTSGTMARGPEHWFEFADLPAGRYEIEATLQSGGKSYGTSQVVDVRPGSSDVTLTLAPAVEIQGTVQVEGRGPKEATSMMSVELERPGRTFGRLQDVVPADGHFKLGPVIPGEWNLDVTGLTSGYLKSARLGDQDVLFKPFEVSANNDAPLNIVVSMLTGAVGGEVDSGGADADRAGIVIARADQYHSLTRFYYAAVADAKGKFHVEGIAPGRYKIFAIEKMAPATFRNPEAADQLDALGETIEVSEGATVEAHPKLIPLERAEKVLP